MSAGVTLSEAEKRMVRVYRINVVLGLLVGVGMFIIIALLSVALVRANAANESTKRLTEETARIVADNCFNIEANRLYYDSLDRSLTQVIRSSPPGTDLTLLRQLVDQARLARNSMITTKCQEAQG